VVVLDIEAVQLHHQLIAIDQALIVRAAMVAAHSQQLLIPPAAHLDVGRADQWLGTHIPESTPSCTETEFVADPDWISARVASETSDTIVATIRNEFWRPTDFSTVR